MSNRHKSVRAHAANTQRTVAAQAGPVNWRKWPLKRQIEFLFEAESAAVLYAQVGHDSPLARLYAQCVAGRPAVVRPDCRHLLGALAAKRTELLTRPDLLPALGLLCTHYPARRREIADWRPQRKNAHYQLESLVRHLFDQYGDVPAWVIGAWAVARPASQGPNLAALTVHLGQGRSLRSFPGLPVALSKRLEHQMRQAPAGCTFLEAYRYAQLAACDALDWFGVVLESRLGRALGSAADEKFWLGVVDFCRAAPLPDRRQFGPLCDWIYQKRSVGIGREPAQAGFSLRGRCLSSLLHQTEAWHRRLARLRGAAGSKLPFHTAWEGLPVPDYVGDDDDEGRVRIEQLTTFGELVEEGRTLQHCVASYLERCRRGRCGIFSLRIEQRPVLTLEVNPNRVIVQVRGRHNRRMAADERQWISRWLGEARLALSPYA